MRLIVEFLRSWYTEGELRDQLKSQGTAQLEKIYLENALESELALRFGTVCESDLQRYLQRADHKSVAEAIDTYDLLIERFQARQKVALLEQVASALFNKGVTHGNLGCEEDATGFIERAFSVLKGVSSNENVTSHFRSMLLSLLMMSTARSSSWALRSLRQLLPTIRKDEAFQVEGRLIKAWVDFHDTGDRRILLKLPAEERQVLEALLAGSDQESGAERRN